NPTMAMEMPCTATNNKTVAIFDRTEGRLWVSISSQVVMCSAPEGRCRRLKLCGRACLYASIIFGIVQPRAVTSRRSGNGVVRFCAGLCVCYNDGNGSRGDDADAGQAA